MNQNNQTLTQENLKKGLKIEDSKKVNLRYKALRMIDRIIELMYSKRAQLLMQKQNFSVEPEDIKAAKDRTKKRMMARHLDGKTTKNLTGSYAELKRIYDEIKLTEGL